MRAYPGAERTFQSRTMKPPKGLGILVLTLVLASPWGCGSTAKTPKGTGESVSE